MNKVLRDVVLVVVLLTVILSASPSAMASAGLRYPQPQWSIRWNLATQTWQLYDGIKFVWGIPASEGDPIDVMNTGYEDGFLWVRVRALYPVGQRNLAPDRTYLVWPYGKPARYGFRS